MCLFWSKRFVENDDIPRSTEGVSLEAYINTKAQTCRYGKISEFLSLFVGSHKNTFSSLYPISIGDMLRLVGFV